MSVEIEVVVAGPPGPKGTTGNTGPTGPQGAKGDKGDKGDTGDLANLDIGTVTTGSPAAAHIDGNFEDGYTLDLTLPSVGAGSIHNADVNAAADIDRSKIAGTALTTTSTGVFSVLDYGATGDGTTDDTGHINAALTAGTGATVLLPPGTYKTTAPLAVPADTKFLLQNGADIVPDSATFISVPFTCVTLAAGATLEGGKITSPPVWDGTNAAWTYAVVLIGGDGVTVRDVTLDGVPRIGIGIRDSDDVLISGCRIHGNLLVDDWNAAWTVLHGICQDTKAGAKNGNLVITGNLIDSCIQGILAANWGDGAPGRGLSITGNTITGCHDHGVYIGQGEGYTVTGNSFNGCRVAVAITGSYHTVVGNAITTATTGASIDTAGLSLRDPVGCVVSNNTIQGDPGTSLSMLDVRELVGVVCRDNVISGNTVIATAVGTAHGIRVGNGAATTFTGNIVANNVVRAPGRQYEAVIQMQAAASGDRLGNAIINNTVTITGPGYGIKLVDLVGARVSGNDVRLEWDAAGADTIGMIVVGDCAQSVITDNTLTVTAAWGANIAIRGIWEAGSTAGSLIARNSQRYDPTKITSADALGYNNSALLDESGAGAPGMMAAVGSVWRRTDGGASTTLYVKESGGWVGK